MLFFIILFVITFSRIILQNIVKFFAGIFFITDPHFPELTVFIQRYTTMVEQIGIIFQIQTSFVEHETDMLLKLLTVSEIHTETLHQFLFRRRKLIRILRINGREILVQKLIGLAFDGDGSLLIINEMKKHTVIHIKFRTPSDQLSFQLKLDDSNGLMHLHVERNLSRIMVIFRMNAKTFTRIIRISFNGKTCQRHQIDSVSIFQHIQIIVASGQSYHIGNAGLMAGSRSHPHHIMIAPLEVHIVKFHQMVHNNVRSRSSVKNISDHMKSGDNQLLNDLRDCYNELFGTIDTNDRVKNLIIILFFLHNPVILTEQFFQNIGKIRWKILSEF